MTRSTNGAPALERSVISVALDQELRAGEVLGLHLSALPPVLHSTEYAAAQPSVRGAPAMNVCNARWRSQLHTGLADRYHLVIGAAALHWIRTRTPRMAHNQIAHLIRLIDQHRAALHLLPEGVPPVGLPPDTLILRGIPALTDQAYVVGYRDWEHVAAPVASLIEAWKRVRQSALSTEATHNHLRKALGFQALGDASQATADAAALSLVNPTQQ